MCSFKDVPGQEEMKRQLEMSVGRNHLSHSYLLFGAKDVGKLTMIRASAKRLLCTGEGLHPCGRCHSYIQIAADTYPDVVTIQRDKTALGVDAMREQLVQETRTRPFPGERRISIVLEVEKTTQQAQNTILKMIEEPPGYAMILLLAEQEEALLPTIRSHVLRLVFHPVPKAKILKRLRAADAPPERTEEVARSSRGTYRRMEELVQVEEVYSRYWKTLELSRELSGCDETVFQRTEAEVTSFYAEPAGFLELLCLYYRDVLCCKSSGNSAALTFPGEEQTLIRVAKALSYEQLGVILREVEAAEECLWLNVGKELTIELPPLAIRRE